MTVQSLALVTLGVSDEDGIAGEGKQAQSGLRRSTRSTAHKGPADTLKV